MAGRPDSGNYRELLLAEVPMMDMRAPAEFARGAFPQSHSLPLMSDRERALVGTCYKQQGQAAAIALGHQLVSGELRRQRLAGWLDFARRHPEGYLYCFRGGLRSQTVQRWLAEAGVDYPLVTGGYKALRQFLLTSLEQMPGELSLRLVSGRTGTGKTRVIAALARSVDLEGRAGHRGSAFGQLPTGQPSQISFENALAVDFLRLADSGDRPVYVEDEGRIIGSLYLPSVLRETMGSAPYVLIEESLEERVNMVLSDYIVDLGRRFTALEGDAGPARHRARLAADLYRIRKRLGGARYQQLAKLLESAFDQQWRSGDSAPHRQWIECLLTGYYDPMYDYQLSQRRGELLFRGSRGEVLAWAGAERC